MSAGPSRRACEALLWFILFFAPAAFGATEWWSRALLEALIFLLAAMCALRGDFAAPPSAPLIGFGAIIALGLLQLLYAQPVQHPAGLLPFTVARAETVYALLLWSALAALFWSASGILRWEGALRRAAWVIFSVGLFIAVVGIVQRGQGNTAYYGLRPIRFSTAFGPFQNPNHAANWLAASTFVGAGLFAELIQRRSRIPPADRAAQLGLAAFVLCLSAASVFATRSRGGFHALSLAALLTAGLVTLPALRGRIRLFLLGGLSLAGLAYGVFLYLNPRWIGLVGGAVELSAGYRLSMYRSALRLLADFPVFGVGLGGFQRAFAGYQDAFVFGRVDHVHSSWLEIVLEAGLPAAVVLGAAFLTPLAALGRRLARAEVPGLHAGCFAAVLALLIHGFVDFNFEIPANAAVTVVLLAAITVILGPNEPRAPAAQPGRILAAAAFCALAVLSLPPGVAGGRPRLGAPFASSGDALLAASRAPAGLE